MRLVLLFAVMSSLSACGIKGKPLPPLPEEPLVTTEEKPVVSQTAPVQPLKTIPTKKKKSN